MLPLNRENTRTIDRTGGTYLHQPHQSFEDEEAPRFLEGRTSRSPSSRKKASRRPFRHDPQVLKNIETLGLDYLIAIGGDDTLSYAATLDKLGFKVIAVPKTMDNDVRNTEYCIGFSTAISAPRTPSTGSAPPSARTSASAFFACLAAMPAIRRCTPRMSPRCAAAFPSTSSTSTRW